MKVDKKETGFGLLQLAERRGSGVFITTAGFYAERQKW